MSSYEVRDARLAEVPYCASMGRRMHDESAFREMDYDEAKVCELAYMSLKMTDKLFSKIIVFRPTDVPVGVLLAGLQRTYFGNDYIAQDLLLMLEKDHRGKCFDAIMRITAMYREWAQERGAKRIYLGTSTGIEPERARIAFEACGFKQIGTLHEA